MYIYIVAYLIMYFLTLVGPFSPLYYLTPPPPPTFKIPVEGFCLPYKPWGSGCFLYMYFHFQNLKLDCVTSEISDISWQNGHISGTGGQISRCRIKKLDVGTTSRLIAMGIQDTRQKYDILLWTYMFLWQGFCQKGQIMYQKNILG
jgi:hypothetical protein